jgi:D-alanyl-D-alanine carboxypeptidase
MQGMLAHVVVNKKGIVSHEEEMFKLNSFYQPYLEETPEVSENIFSMANCPVGNEEADYSLFDSNLENSVGKYIPAGLVEIQDVLKTKDGREICLTEDTANHLKEMVDAAKKAGAEIIVTSGFRSFDTQKTLYDNSRGTRPETDNESIAPPGHSEHQLGTTIDLTSPDISSVSAAGSFKDTKEFAWLSKNAYKYGFVMSYPANGNTGYIYEPWHFRYLGTDIAKEIRSKDITTQEYLETL